MRIKRVTYNSYRNKEIEGNMEQSNEMFLGGKGYSGFKHTGR